MMEATLYYNEKKADGPEGIRKIDDPMLKDEYGHVVVTRNVPDDSTLEDEFERLRVLNSRKAKGRHLEKAAFHMSVNPGINDRLLSDAMIVALVDEIMQDMGYGQCPYRIYKHNDIEREHYHVVSCRIGQDGKKIKDSFENKRVNRLAERLAEKYGFTVGLEDDQVGEDLEDAEELSNPDEGFSRQHTGPVQDNSEPDDDKTSEDHEPEPEPEPKKKFVPPFDKESSVPVKDQLKQIHDEAMTWAFTTPEQYKALLRWRFNVEVEEFEDGVHFIGLDKKGKEATQLISEKDLGADVSNDIINKCTSTDMKKRKAQKRRIETYAETESKNCSSLKEFRKRMHEKGIYVVISFTEDGQPFGVTWLDRATKCAFKGSETRCNLAWLKNMAETNGWRLERTHRFDKTASIRKNYKSRYRINSEIQKRVQQKKDEALTRQILRDQDERSSGSAINKAELNDDPNNIKI